MRHVLYFAIFLFVFTTVSSLLIAQTALPTSDQGTASPINGLSYPVVPQRGERAPFPVFFVPDGSGGLVPIIPGLTLQQIEDLVKLMYGQTPEPYSIQSLSVEGQVVGNAANLTIQMRIQTRNESVISIPIGLKSGILSTPSGGGPELAVQYDGPSQFDIRTSPQGDYNIVLWSKPTTPEEQAVPQQETSSDETQTPASPEVPVPAPEDIPAPEAVPAENDVPVDDSPGEDTPADVAPVGDVPTALLEERFPENSGENNGKSEPESQNLIHHVTLQMIFPVTQPTSNEFQLKAEFPAALNSQLQLEVPLPEAVIMHSQDAVLQQTVPFSETSTLFAFQRIRGDFELQWHEKQHTTVKERVVLRVEEAAITAKLTQSGVLFDATLPVQASGGMFDSFQLQLPPGAVYRPSQHPEDLEYQVTVLPREQDVETDVEQEAASNPAICQVLQFQLTQPAEGLVLVQVQAETPASNSQNGLFEVCGFNIPGAERQSGKISIIVPAETRLHQEKNSRGVRQSQVTGMTDTEGIVSTFEYYEQNSSLLVQAVPQATRVNLRPEYQVQINRNHAVLTAKLSYTIHGGLNDLKIDMNGWQLTDIRPETVVNSEEIPFMEDGPISISLLKPVGKKVDLSLRASRSFNPEDGDGEIRFSFPVPEADFVDPAIVAVIPADNIELKMGSDTPVTEMVHKSRRTTQLDIELPPRQQEAMIYQIDHPAKAEFRAKVIPQKQKIFVQSQTEATLHTDERVVQTLQYTVEYEPISRLNFAVPAEWTERNDLRVTFESQSLPLFTVSTPGEIESSTNGLSNNTVFKQIQLPDAKIGTFQVVFSFVPDQKFSKKIASLRPTTTVQEAVPLIVPILPREQSEIRQTVHVRYPRGLQVLHDDENSTWREQRPAEYVRQTQLSSSVYQSETAVSSLMLGVSLRNTESIGSTTIEKGWLRSWLLPSGRVDYAAYQITSNLSHLSVAFPERVQLEQVTVHIDGKKVVANPTGKLLRIPLVSAQENTASTTTGTGTSSTTLPTSAMSTSQNSGLWVDILDSERPHLMEIWYDVPTTTSVNQLSLDMPRFTRDVVVRPVYFQIILPSSRHLLSCNQNWLPQYQWQWSIGFKRQSVLTQTELEDWIGVPHREPVSPEMNSYLFISFQPGENCEIGLADRSTLILVSSGLILLFGLIFLYFPRTRYPAVVFTLLVLFVSIFIYRVSLMTVFLQAGVIGIVLVLIASFLYRIFVSADPWRNPLANPLSSTTRGYSKAIRKGILATDDDSDLARVKVAPVISPGGSEGSKSGDSRESTQFHAPPLESSPQSATEQENSNDSRGSTAEPGRGDHA